MQTHFFKPKKTPQTPLRSQLQSILYNLIPNDRLVTKNDILTTFEAFRQAKPQEVLGTYKSMRDVEGTIKLLADAKFLQEVHGIRLLKFLEGI